MNVENEIGKNKEYLSKLELWKEKSCGTLFLIFNSLVHIFKQNQKILDHMKKGELKPSYFNGTKFFIEPGAVKSGDALDSLSDMRGICREYYGDDKNNKPNDHCFWDDFYRVTGWHETGDHFRKRVTETML